MFTNADAAADMRRAIDLIVDPFVPVLKAALAALSDEPGFARVRAPLRPADPALGQRVAASLRALDRRAAA